MPAAISRREDSLIPEWRRGDKVQREGYSTTQDSALWNRNDLPPRMMDETSHGRQQNGNTLPRNPSPSFTTPQNSSYQGSTHQQQNHVDATSRSPWQRQRPATNVIASGKRKAGLAVKTPSARRRRMEYSNTKASQNLPDAEYLCRTMDLPTRSEYPSLPEGLLKSPKSMLHNATQGLMKLHSTFSVTAASHFECQLYCMISAKDTINVVGAGVNKVCSAQNLERMDLLTSGRKLQSKSHTSICWPSFTKMGC